MHDRKFGDILSERRLRMGYTIEQAVAVTKLRPQVLEAFERSDFEAMPPQGYASGMLSSYARFLHLNPREVLEPYNEQLYIYERERGLQERSDRLPRYESYAQVSRRRPGVGRTDGVYTGNASQGLTDTHVVYTRGSRQSQRYRSSSPDRSYGNVYSRYSSRREDDGYRDQQRGGYDDYQDDYRNDYEDRGYASSSRRGSRSGRDQRNGRLDPIDNYSEYSKRDRRRSSRGSRGGGSGRGGAGSILDNLPIPRNYVLIGIAVVALLVLILIMTSLIKSCTSGAPEKAPEQTKIIQPVTQTLQPQPAAPVEGVAATAGAPAQTGQAGTEAQADPNKTVVEVSVAEGKESYVEVFLDGQNVFMATVKGPKTQTYTVKDEIVVSATNPKNVTVTQNGKKVAMKTTADVGSVKIKAKTENKDASGSESSGN